MKYIVKTPNPNYNGVTEGVAFANGEAIVEDEIIMNVLKTNYHYSVLELIEKEKEKAPVKSKSTEKK